MKLFTNLYLALEHAANESEKLYALKDYFAGAQPASAAWATFFLSGKRLATSLKTSRLQAWAQEQAHMPDWLFQECYRSVKDLSETIALILPPPPLLVPATLAEIAELKLKELINVSPEKQRLLVIAAWQNLDHMQRFVFNKLATDSFATGVSSQLLVKALSQHSGADIFAIAQRLAGAFQPSDAFFISLCNQNTQDVEFARTYPFHLAGSLAGAEPGTLLNNSAWYAEWLWPGIRAQLVKRQGIVSIWSRQEELLSERLPELMRPASNLADGIVLDGQVLAWRDADILPLHLLKKRLACLDPAARMMQEIPVIYMAYDLLEENGRDLRAQPIELRLERLQAVLSTSETSGSPALYEQLQLFAPCLTKLSPCLRQSPLLCLDSQSEIIALQAQAAAMKTAGIMLKRKGSPYGTDGQNCNWYKFKPEPIMLQAVLVAAQMPKTRREGLFSDYTFALWHKGELLSFARAQFEIWQKDIIDIDSFVRANTLSRAGPVHNVKAELVFVLACRGLQPSGRYQAGISVNSCRIISWQRDASAVEADCLERARELLS